MLNSSSVRLCLIITVPLALGLGCNEPAQNSGFCFNDEECTEGMTCDLATRRCTQPSELTLRTDAALDRVLDMEIDAMIVDAMVVDAMVVDAMIEDASTLDALPSDLSVVDANVQEDSSALDAQTDDTDVEMASDGAVQSDGAIDPDVQSDTGSTDTAVF
jgi:hypothetical protein